MAAWLASASARSKNLTDHSATHLARKGPTILRWTAIPVQEAIKSVRARAASGGITLPEHGHRR
jgi:hypothetical protein